MTSQDARSADDVLDDIDAALNGYVEWDGRSPDDQDLLVEDMGRAMAVTPFPRLQVQRIAVRHPSPHWTLVVFDETQGVFMPVPGVERVQCEVAAEPEDSVPAEVVCDDRVTRPVRRGSSAQESPYGPQRRGGRR